VKMRFTIQQKITEIAETGRSQKQEKQERISTEWSERDERHRRQSDEVGASERGQRASFKVAKKTKMKIAAGPWLSSLPSVKSIGHSGRRAGSADGRVSKMPNFRSESVLRYLRDLL
jgi:hypothetical protein